MKLLQKLFLSLIMLNAAVSPLAFSMDGQDGPRKNPDREVRHHDNPNWPKACTADRCSGVNCNHGNGQRNQMDLVNDDNDEGNDIDMNGSASTTTSTNSNQEPSPAAVPAPDAQEDDFSVEEHPENDNGPLVDDDMDAPEIVPLFLGPDTTPTATTTNTLANSNDDDNDDAVTTSGSSTSSSQPEVFINGFLVDNDDNDDAIAVTNSTSSSQPSVSSSSSSSLTTTSSTPATTTLATIPAATTTMSSTQPSASSSSSSSSSSTTIAYVGPVGLKNLGNTCFMNAAIQCILASPLAEYLFRNENNFTNDSTIRNFINVLRGLQNRNLTSDVLNAFLNDQTLQTLRVNRANNSQQDANEFLLDLFAGIERIDNNCDLVKVSKISSYECPVGNGHFSQGNPEFESSIIDLGIAQSDTLENCLNAHFQGFVEARCDACNTNSFQTKKSHFIPTPKFLVMHLKRFSRDNNVSIKDSKALKFPLTLNFEHASQEQQNNYELIGFVSHRGSLNGGHYIAYTKDVQGHWGRFDDNNVTQIQDDQIRTVETTGMVNDDYASGDSQFTPYILFYKKIETVASATITTTASASSSSSSSSSTQLDAHDVGAFEKWCFGSDRLKHPAKRKRSNDEEQATTITSSSSSSSSSLQPAVLSSDDELMPSKKQHTNSIRLELIQENNLWFIVAKTSDGNVIVKRQIPAPRNIDAVYDASSHSFKIYEPNGNQELFVLPCNMAKELFKDNLAKLNNGRCQLLVQDDCFVFYNPRTKEVLAEFSQPGLMKNGFFNKMLGAFKDILKKLIPPVAAAGITILYHGVTTFIKLDLGYGVVVDYCMDPIFISLLVNFSCKYLVSVFSAINNYCEETNANISPENPFCQNL